MTTELGINIAFVWILSFVVIFMAIDYSDRHDRERTGRSWFR